MGHPSLIVIGVALASSLPAQILADEPSPYRKLAILGRVLAEVEASHVDPIDEDALMEGAVAGLLARLDPHSAWLSPEELALFQEDTNGVFGGVGLEVDGRDGRLTVVTPLLDGPAARAGVRAGDEIVAVDGHPVERLSLEAVVRTMRGRPGTQVTATFRRGGGPPFEVGMTREVIRIETVRVSELGDGLVRVAIRGFTAGTAEEVSAALTARGSSLRGLVLDLRHNPGGLLDEGTRLADLFLARGVIVTTRGCNGRELERVEADAGDPGETLPVVVLVDRASASAAEIVALALQENGRARLVGERSYGKGTVQEVLPLSDGSGLKLTVARYHGPLGRAIDGAGVIPEVVVASPGGPPSSDGPDPQLERALAELVTLTVKGGR